jgi:hypothetical protein
MLTMSHVDHLIYTTSVGPFVRRDMKWEFLERQAVNGRAMFDKRFMGTKLNYSPAIPWDHSVLGAANR